MLLFFRDKGVIAARCCSDLDVQERSPIGKIDACVGLFVTRETGAFLTITVVVIINNSQSVT